MKRIAILLLVLSLMVLGGCGTETAPSGEISQPGELSQEEALNEIDSSLIGEDEEIEIGEMI